MCFFNRAQKSKQSTSKTPAPGSHFDSTIKTVSVQCAPFGSSQSRAKTYKRSISAHISPGPGHYDAGQPQQSLEIQLGFQKLKIQAKGKYQSVFKSKLERFTESNTATPGPGSYQVSPKNKPNENVSVKRQKQQKYQTLLNKQQKMKIPSIPQSVNKGYKYIEGKLIRIDNETNKNELGPGFYELPEQYSTKNIIEWRKTLTTNKPTRKTNFNNLLNQYRGPGRYNPQASQPKYIQSSFCSKSKRSFQVQNSNNIPGPGSYLVQQFGQSMNSNDQHFGSKSNRFATASTDNIKLGPGEYFKSGEITRSNLSNEESVQNNFCVKQPRGIQNQTPGPGSYQVLSKSQNKKLFSAIMSSSSRQCQQFKSKQGPGPGNYDTSFKNPSFMKPLRSQSCSLIVRRPQQPPLTQSLYKIQNFTITHKLKMNSHLNPQKHISHPFNSGSQRFKYSVEGKRQNANTNMLKQESKQMLRSKNESKQLDRLSSKTSFNVSSQRPKRIVNNSPGPGAYDMNLNILKQTFNSKILNMKKV